MAIADETRIEQVRKDGYVFAWTHQVLFVRFSYVGDAAPSLDPSTYLRSILLPAILTVFLHFSQRNNWRHHLVAYIEILNHHSNRQLITCSIYKSLSLSHIFVSALSTSDSPTPPSSIASRALKSLTFNRVPNQWTISRSGSSSFTCLIPIVFSHLSHSCSF